MRSAVILVLLAVVSHARADEVAYTPPDFLAQTPPLPPSHTGPNVLRLDLAETLRIAVRHNLAVVLERKEVAVAELGVIVAGGQFEPTITAGYAHGDVRAPAASSLEGKADEIFKDVSDSWRVGLHQRLSTGTQLDVDYDNGRVKSTGGGAVQPLNYRSTLAASITQPLLRGFSTDLTIPKVEVLRAHIASERQRQQLGAAIADLVERAETAYWGVLLSLFRYDLAARSHKAAEDQMQLTRRQIEAGTLPPSDLIGAESTLAQRSLELVQADEATHQAMDVLRAVLQLPRDQWTRPILPIDVPRFSPGVSSAEDALGLAIKNRPELAQIALDLKAAALATRQAENDRLPQIDLGVTGTLFGQDDAYGGSLSQLTSTDARGWSVTLNLIWQPLRRSSSAAATIAKIQRDQTQLRREQLTQEVWLEVRDAVRNQLGAERRVKAAAKFRELAEKSLEIEQRKFMNGQSQNLFVAQRQEALAVARLAELDALLAHTRAATTLHRSTGRLLVERHIKLE
jgi:outer membrane protein